MPYLLWCTTYVQLLFNLNTYYMICYHRKEIQEVNWQRKSLQTMGGEKLRALESQWVALVSKNYEIEQACVELEQKISEHRNLHKIENESNTNSEDNQLNEKPTVQEQTSTNNVQKHGTAINENVLEKTNTESKTETDIFEDSSK